MSVIGFCWLSAAMLAYSVAAQYGYSPPTSSYSPPPDEYYPPSSSYAPPHEEYHPPSSSYAPPEDDYHPPSSSYAPPDEVYSPPDDVYAPPHVINRRSPGYGIGYPKPFHRAGESRKRPHYDDDDVYDHNHADHHRFDRHRGDDCPPHCYHRHGHRDCPSYCNDRRKGEGYSKGPVRYRRSTTYDSYDPHHGGDAYDGHHGDDNYDDRHDGYKGDYKADSYGRDDSKRHGGSYSGSQFYGQSSKNDFFNYVIEVNGKHGGRYDYDYPWNVDCNGHSYEYQYGFITAIWDDKDDFGDLDKIKCSGAKDSYSGFKLDLRDQKRIALSPKSKDHEPECYRGYVLTALYDDHYGFKHVMYGKCVKLSYGSVDYNYCDNFHTSYKHGGPYDAYSQWNVECPKDWAAVGLKRDYKRIEFLRCCKLDHPH